MRSRRRYLDVRERLERASQAVQRFFHHVHKLLQPEIPLSVSLVYAFALAEAAHRFALYIGVVKRFNVNATIAWEAILRTRIGRDDLPRLFGAVLGVPLPHASITLWNGIASVRNRVAHGKSVDTAQQRTALLETIRYAEEFNAYVNAAGAGEPFGGKFRGRLGGRRRRLNEETSRLVLKGLGFSA